MKSQCAHHTIQISARCAENPEEFPGSFFSPQVEDSDQMRSHLSRLSCGEKNSQEINQLTRNKSGERIWEKSASPPEQTERRTLASRPAIEVSHLTPPVQCYRGEKSPSIITLKRVKPAGVFTSLKETGRWARECKETEERAGQRLSDFTSNYCWRCAQR